MISVVLAQITTRDRITLDGIVIEPRKKSATALIWIHGLGSNFSHGQSITRELSQTCLKNGIAYFKFNTRGHDVVNRDAPKRKAQTIVNRLRGAGFERFEDCVLDIRAVIHFARKLGYRKVILVGHSTGANKALYYLYKTKDPAVKGLILLGAISDIAAGKKKFGATGLARGIALAEKRARKNSDALMPLPYGIFSAKRFLSMFRQGDSEDVFPYLNPRAAWKELKTIRAPIAVIFGSRDQYLDRPAEKLVEIFRSHALSTKSFSGVIIKGADHGFKGKEKMLSKVVMDWIQQQAVV
ncbi:MAG: hypothetical protein A3J10_03725 [Candidatus Sungbacteria bacterium RIFCSPLOWO2_02_FULL_54_10]|uniref:Serine aminopeptidase S33 domain-containing protein n=1 Tax=Candidatus Sungbacteria bacterium RIFCSPHIGHO2_02_FULL_53_17 TaxID=1802275 RepID=A0A1G2KTK5_9BACT|nr:MAG: hypothetical protein A2679_01795 [Candidatus Sungbacteria bacterium RIFCSPHIGHO2_01_FULL_54_26]OHA02767.1 MAG: hypothetical protein A3C92_00730 [Candidatus Sungbacteria bacterium RIFCSPHIGHO2_02_FULL_53_17]OHA12596.1 MAG: hypothetical protein A3J10_03725 [Candidatus Sungbacteria bacterium RIFCSPLOWO2_02_FULL_54_10]